MEVTGTSFSEKIVISSVLFLLTVTYLVQGSHSFGRKNPGLFQYNFRISQVLLVIVCSQISSTFGLQ